MDELFRLEGVGYDEWIAFDDMTIQSGSPCFLMGDSGCGKSTMLRLFNAILSPTEGNIYYRGRNINEYESLQLRKEVSLVQQDAFLFDETIWRNFLLFYSFRELPQPDEKTIRKFLDLCNIEFSLDRDCTSMSGGERQRIFIAVFLSFLPKVILLDEPTSALDEKTADIVVSNIISFCKENGIDLVAVSHNKKIVQKHSEQTIILERGGDYGRSCKIRYTSI